MRRPHIAFILLILFIVPCHAFSQDRRKIDSLQARLHNERIDTSRVNILLAMSAAYLSGKTSSALDTSLLYAQKALGISAKSEFMRGMSVSYTRLAAAYSKKGDRIKAFDMDRKALEIAEKTDNRLLIAKCLNSLAARYAENAKYGEAEQMFLKALVIMEALHDKSGIASVNTRLGSLYNKRDEGQKAMAHHLKALELYEQLGDMINLRITYNNIGNVYHGLKNYAKAVEYYNSALRTAEKDSATLQVASILINLGASYSGLQDYAKAIELYKRAENIFSKLGAKDKLAAMLINVSDLYIRSGKYEEALNESRKAIEICRELKMANEEIVCLYNMAQAFYLMDNAGQAIVYAQQSLDLASSAGLSEDVMEAGLLLARSYARKGDHKRAYTLHTDYTAMRDSLLRRGDALRAAEMEARYKDEKKSREIEALTYKADVLSKENEIQKLSLAKKNYILFGSIAMVLLGALAAFLMIKQKRTKMEARAIELEQKLLRAQMNPHFVFNSLNSIQSFIFKSDPRQAGTYLSRFAELTRMILENSRENYVSLEKEIRSLNYYLELQQLRFDNKFEYNIDVSPDLDTEEIGIPPMLAQPFIENALEHGILHKQDKGRIQVRFFLKDDRLIFEVEDDGVGRKKALEIKQSLKPSHRSLATTITQERISIINRESRKRISMNIVDLGNTDKSITGTKVIFSIPVMSICN